MRARLVTGLTIAATLSIGVGVALATFQPDVLYKPPVIKAIDHEGHMSVEDVVIRREGSDFTFDSSPSPFKIHAQSDPGCVDAAKVSCPRAGVEKVVALLGAMNDSADIDLGKSADKVRHDRQGPRRRGRPDGRCGSPEARRRRSERHAHRWPRPGHPHRRTRARTSATAVPVTMSSSIARPCRCAERTQAVVATLRRPMTCGTRNLALLLLLPRWGS